MCLGSMEADLSRLAAMPFRLGVTVFSLSGVFLLNATSFIALKVLGWCA